FPLLLCAGLAKAHFVITYPGWRGNTLRLNETFPNGMQREALCGGLPVTQNRTAWPVDGPGAFAIQPGWYANNEYTEFFISIGLGPDPDDFSQQIHSFRVMGPTNDPFPDSFCLPQVNIPQEVRRAHGDFATIQIRQVHVSGNSAHNCADIYFTDDPSEMEEIDTTWCFNSTRIDVQPLRLVHTTRITSDESTMTSAETQQSSAARPLPESTTEPLATPTAGGSDEFTGA
ncbi:hypothetical protein S40285_08454, partial [Stachybotrys chlorohalonatus IBT 40285]